MTYYVEDHFALLVKVTLMLAVHLLLTAAK